ncbi:MAG: hypothetical protein EBU08_08790 [Micrococcales bacterium]|nr:hypothetical protein [Micrococcales bacterium]
MLDQIEIDLCGNNDQLLTVYIDVADNSLSRKWLAALNDIVQNDLHLEKNYCWLGWAESARSAEYLCTQINRSINVINSSSLDYRIQDFFSPSNVIETNLGINHSKMNQLHRYFEDLQGTAGAMSPYYNQADDYTRWHIRQLNLLCHELESLVLSMRKAKTAPEWRRPSQLMCWLNAPRFELEAEDYDLFGIDTINRCMGGVYVGVNKAVGKHHWEVFQDEGRDSRIGELITTSLRSQTQAAGDFDIEWSRDPGAYPWQIQHLAEFREWLERNGFDPDEPSLTIGHPQVGSVDLQRSFGTENWENIYSQLSQHQDVYKIRTSTAEATYNYHWSDPDYTEQQIRSLK